MAHHLESAEMLKVRCVECVETTDFGDVAEAYAEAEQVSPLGEESYLRHRRRRHPHLFPENPPGPCAREAAHTIIQNCQQLILLAENQKGQNQTTSESP